MNFDNRGYSTLLFNTNYLSIYPSRESETQISNFLNKNLIMDSHKLISILKFLDDYNVINKGSNGFIIFSCYYPAYVAKVLPRFHQNSEVIYDPYLELSALSLINSSENCIPYYGYEYFEEKTVIYFPKYNATVHDIIQFNQGLNCIKKLAYQVLNSLYQIHSKHITHFDIKPENILISDDLENYILTDFGLSQYLGNFRLPKDSVFNPTIPEINKHIQTAWFRAPEVFLSLKGEGISNKIDIWSVGILILTIINKNYIFNSHDESDIFIEAVSIANKNEFDMKYINGSKYSEFKDLDNEKLETYIFDLPEDLKELIRGLLNFNPLDRPSAYCALNMDFFDSIRDNIEKVSTLNSIRYNDIYHIPVNNINSDERVLKFNELMIFSDKLDYTIVNCKVLSRTYMYWDIYCSQNTDNSENYNINMFWACLYITYLIDLASCLDMRKLISENIDFLDLSIEDTPLEYLNLLITKLSNFFKNDFFIPTSFTYLEVLYEEYLYLFTNNQLCSTNDDDDSCTTDTQLCSNNNNQLYPTIIKVLTKAILFPDIRNFTRFEMIKGVFLHSCNILNIEVEMLSDYKVDSNILLWLDVISNIELGTMFIEL